MDKRISEVTGEFSLDNEDSALSRLMQGVERAQRQISSEFDLNEDGSALARMQKKAIGGNRETEQGEHGFSKLR